MTGPPVADRALELRGRQVRRLTRRAAAARADIGVFARIGDALGYLVTVGAIVAFLGGSMQSFHGRQTMSSHLATGHPLPGQLTAVAVGVMALAGLVFLLDRLGPVNTTPPAAAWWLPLPAGRRGLLLGQLARTTGIVVVGAVLVALGPVLTLVHAPTAATVVAGLGWAAAPAALAVAGTALLQTRGRGGLLAAPAGALAVLVGLALLTLAAASAVAPRGPRPPAPGSLPEAAEVAVAALAVVLFPAAALGLDRLSAEQLRARGAVAGFAAASVLSLDARDLGRALAGPVRRPRHSLRFGLVRRPWQAVCAADLVVLVRDRLRWGQLALAVVLPVLVAHLPVAGAVPLLVWAGCVVGWLLAGSAAGAPARAAQAAPAIDRLLPLSTTEVVRARFAVPLAVLVAVCGATGVLLGLGIGAVGGWTAVALACAPAWAAAALRAAYRPDLDWSGELLATPVGPVPVGVLRTLVQGVDVGVVGSLPLVLAFLHGRPTAGVIAAQLGWAVVLAAAALGALARRLGSPG